MAFIAKSDWAFMVRSPAAGNCPMIRNVSLTRRIENASWVVLWTGLCGQGAGQEGLLEAWLHNFRRCSNIKRRLVTALLGSYLEKVLWIDICGQSVGQRGGPHGMAPQFLDMF